MWVASPGRTEVTVKARRGLSALLSHNAEYLLSGLRKKHSSTCLCFFTCMRERDIMRKRH